MHEYTGRNVNLIGSNFNEILWFLDYSGDKPIPQHYLMPHKDGAGGKELFSAHEAQLSRYCRDMHSHLLMLTNILDWSAKREKMVYKNCTSWRREVEGTICAIEEHLSLLQNYKKNLQYDVLVGDNDCTFLTNIISFVKENKPVYPNMKFTIVVNGATQYQKLIGNAFSYASYDSAFTDLYNFITKDPRYTVVQDAKQQVLDYLSVTGSPEYADCIEVVDILQIILCDLGPNIIFADQDYAPEDVACALDSCASAIKENRRAKEKPLYLNQEKFETLEIEKQLAINIVHNYMIFYCKENEFSRDNKAHLFDLVASFLSALRGAVVPNADFYCHNALECYKDENYIPKDDRVVCVLDARSMLFFAKRLLENSMALTNYFEGGRDAVLSCDYLRKMVTYRIEPDTAQEFWHNMYVGSVFALCTQNATFNEKRKMRKKMLAIQCDALEQEKLPHSSPMLLFVHDFSVQQAFKFPVHVGIHPDFSCPMDSAYSEQDKQIAFELYYCHSQHYKVLERFFRESGHLLSSSIRDEFNIFLDDARKISNFMDIAYSYNRALVKRGLFFSINPACVFVGKSTSRDPVVAALNTASDIQILLLFEMMKEEIEEFLPLLSVLTSD